MFESPVGSAIKAFKFDDIRALGPVLGGLFDTKALLRSNADFVVPVPLHSSRFRARGYNQSEVLARILASRLGLEFHSDVLERTRDTTPQTAQPTAAARQESMTGAFEVMTGVLKGESNNVAGKRILLVDDVFTTGSTVKSCATALKLAGANWVGVVTLAVQP